ncbi:endonuclease/exonuclease/phosphatase family protein [Olivibacter sitiensis]|uniref:endonuclease/exonuclease/phosphatase family protein n=1 Tax=Olivibacter sitiensis TaxID=376470 RepID=UPI000425C480|nr:endonuclease/exonuclease/phosphatase family protein [Olivibacter sitiensis]
MTYTMLPKLPNRRKRFFVFPILILLFGLLSFRPWEHRPLLRRSKVVTLPEEPAPLPLASAGEFSVITYNIAGLPEPISSAKTSRASSIARIGNLLNGYDIANVQEDFNYNDELYHGGNGHPYRTTTKGSVLFGDGLNTLSKFPIHDVRRVAWKDCTGPDCLTPKGFSYSRIQLAQDVWIDCYNVHANAENHLKAAAARRNNMEQLSNYIKEHSKGKAVIVMGDFNAYYGAQWDNMHQFIMENGLKDGWTTLRQDDVHPVPSSSFKVMDNLLVTDSCESIDKVLFRNSKDLLLEPDDYWVENKLFVDDRGNPLSDHCAVSLRFRWQLTKP